MGSASITESQQHLLLLIHQLGPITRRVLEYAYKVRIPTDTPTTEVREDLRQLRGKSLVERFETADAPAGQRDVIYTITPGGTRLVLGSRVYAAARQRWAALEKRRPELAGVLDRFELVLAPSSDLLRIVDYQVLTAADALRVEEGRQPDVRATVQYRARARDPWLQRRVLFAFESLFTRYRKGAEWHRDHSLPITEEVVMEAGGRLRWNPRPWGADLFVLILRSKQEAEELMHSTREIGWYRGGSLFRSLMRSGGAIALTTAQSWSEIRPLKESGASGAQPRSALVLRHPREIQAELFAHERR